MSQFNFIVKKDNNPVGAFPNEERARTYMAFLVDHAPAKCAYSLWQRGREQEQKLGEVPARLHAREAERRMREAFTRYTERAKRASYWWEDWKRTRLLNAKMIAQSLDREAEQYLADAIGWASR